MSTKRRSKWFALISIGLLLVVFPNFIEHLSSRHISEGLRISFMIGGIILELVGLILIRKERKITDQH